MLNPKNAHRGCFLKAISDRVHQKVNPVLPSTSSGTGPWYTHSCCAVGGSEVGTARARLLRMRSSCLEFARETESCTLTQPCPLGPKIWADAAVLPGRRTVQLLAEDSYIKVTAKNKLDRTRQLH